MKDHRGRATEGLVACPLGDLVVATKVTSRSLIFKTPPGTNPPTIRKTFDRHIVRTDHGVVVTDVRMKTMALPRVVPFSEILDTAREEVDAVLKEEGKEKTDSYEEGVRMLAERLAWKLCKRGVKIV